MIEIEWHELSCIDEFDIWKYYQFSFNSFQDAFKKKKISFSMMVKSQTVSTLKGNFKLNLQFLY